MGPLLTYCNFCDKVHKNVLDGYRFENRPYFGRVNIYNPLGQHQRGLWCRCGWVSNWFFSFLSFRGWKIRPKTEKTGLTLTHTGTLSLSDVDLWSCKRSRDQNLAWFQPWHHPAHFLHFYAKVTRRQSGAIFDPEMAKIRKPVWPPHTPAPRAPLMLS